MEPIPDPSLKNLRISYLALLLPTCDRRKILSEQFYFTCQCEYCQADVPSTAPTLSCSRCGSSVPLTRVPCAKCGTPLSETAVEQYETWSTRVQSQLKDKASDESLFESFEKGLSVCTGKSLQMVLLCNEIITKALSKGDLERCVQALNIIVPYTKDYYHRNSLVFWNDVTELSKALFCLGRVEEGRKHFSEAISIVRLTHGEDHILYKYMMSFRL